MAELEDSIHVPLARRTEMSDIEVTIKGFLLLVFAFVAGYFVALLRERIALRREQHAERSYPSSEEQHS